MAQSTGAAARQPRRPGGRPARSGAFLQLAVVFGGTCAAAACALASGRCAKAAFAACAAASRGGSLRSAAAGGRSHHAVRRAAAVGTDGAVALIADQWRDEAERCWAKDENGIVPGWIGDMVTPGREYDPLLRMYVNSNKKPQPNDPRPWRRLDGAAPQRDGRDQRQGRDQREEDFEEAMGYFGKDGEDAVGGGTVIDVGCGDSYMARRFLGSGRFERAFAFDVDWRQLEMARMFAEREGTGPDQGLLLLRADAQELPFREASVDFAWWGMGMHKVQDADAALSAIFAALKPGGRVLATTISTMGREDVEQKARDAGFSDVEVEQPRDSKLVLRAVK
mmetsp:Transcript_2607/g.7883  ORF Transcript_2607/g.7883 Transcript_2607/m.7883 type:complete len:337 (+) Transcript_2607:59-1069(+)